MLVFVDYEHPDGYGREFGQRIQAARTWITYRLEDVSGMHCMLVRYNRISQELLARLEVKAIFISGNATDPDHYDQGELEPLGEIIRTTHLPIFGFCGGFQLITQALGADVVPITVPENLTDHHSLTTLDDGRPFEFGYHPVDLTVERASHPLLAKVQPRPVFRHAHGLHVPSPPPGFRVIASSEITPIQFAVNDDRKIAGTQFHPEYYTDEHPDGRQVIANFLTWGGVI